MDRAVYNVIKMEATQSTAAHKRKLLNAVPLLSVLSQVCPVLNAHLEREGDHQSGGYDQA